MISHASFVTQYFIDSKIPSACLFRSAFFRYLIGSEPTTRSASTRFVRFPHLPALSDPKLLKPYQWRRTSPTRNPSDPRAQTARNPHDSVSAPGSGPESSIIHSASSLDQDGSEGSGVGRVSDERETSKLDFDGSSCKVENGSRSEITKSGIGDFNSMASSELLADGFGSNEAMNGGAEEMTFFTAKIGKYGVTSDGKKQDFHGNAPPWLAVSEGFTVRKFQTRNVEGADEFEEYEEFELKVPAGSAVLFPTENAVGIDEVKMMHFEVKNLIVLDGTWAKAKRMYAENPWLKLLPHLRLDVDRMSLYGEVRQQPKEGYLSTIESIVHSLKALGEDQEGLEGLLDVFESMVADQRRCKDERLNKVSMN